MTHRIDAHHQVRDPAVRNRPSIDSDAMAAIERSLDVEELAANASANGIGGTVVVPTVSLRSPRPTGYAT